jgi:hypothetical protein
MLHKNYYRKGLVEKKISGRESQRDWHQDELTGQSQSNFYFALDSVHK